MSARIEQAFAKAFDFSAPVVYFPVRHHSPACSLHLAETIRRYDPRLILVEGPADACHLIPLVTDQATVPPFCIYYSFDDREGRVSPECEKYRAYYPFLDYSPEYTALKSAAERKIPARFIDMPYAARLCMPKTGETAPLNRRHDDEGEYEVNAYTALLTKNAGFRSFAEFWEAFYEIPAASLETPRFVNALFTLAWYMREADPVSDEDAARESFMLEQIGRAAKECGRILVVSGAFHTPALAGNTPAAKYSGGAADEPARAEAVPNASLYLMPYTFTEMDGRKGYAAGMPFPAYYGALNRYYGAGEGEAAFAKTACDFVVKTARFLRNKSSVSIPDEANALSMASSLAALRGKRAPGVYERIDGVRSSFVKGDINTTVTPELDYLFRNLSGVGAGRVAAQEAAPPVVSDFREKCREHHVKIDSTLPRKITLSIVKDTRHYRKSRFFHQLVFLETGFCRCLSGPDYVSGRDKNLAREIWEYRYDSKVETVLVDKSVFGTTVAELCVTLARRSFADGMGAEALGRLLISAEVMGITDFYESCAEEIISIIDNEGNFTGASSCLQSLRELKNLQTLLRAGDNGGTQIPALMTRCYKRSVLLLESGRTAGESGEQRYSEGLRSLYALSVEEPLLCDPLLLRERAASLLADGFCNSRFYGTLLAVGRKQELISMEEFTRRINSRLESSLDDAPDAASFIAGVFLVGRDALFAESGVFEAIDRVIANMDDRVFVSILPNLRLAFTAFLPPETGRIAGMASAAHGGDAGDITNTYGISGEELEAGMTFDGEAAAQMRFWGLLDE
ncbi:MAG: DUF5682 family protein [Treponema sp.]|jgi:hypothetical protein|nr:DUF5682 family protein [Treponema sp.]